MAQKMLLDLLNCYTISAFSTTFEVSITWTCFHFFVSSYYNILEAKDTSSSLVVLGC